MTTPNIICDCRYCRTGEHLRIRAEADYWINHTSENLSTGNTYVYVWCTSCGARGPWVATKKTSIEDNVKAMSHWNQMMLF